MHEHEHLAAVGDLAECWIVTPTGLLVQLAFEENDRPILAINEEGSQLYIEGGDQSVALADSEMDGENWQKDRMVLGTFAEPSDELEKEQRKLLEKGEKYDPWNLAYVTQKDFDQFETIQYQHDLGEGNSKRDRKESPLLAHDPVNEQLYIEGGQYIVNQPVFGTSPGIEN